jgi:lysine-N-methylase
MERSGWMMETSGSSRSASNFGSSAHAAPSNRGANEASLPRHPSYAAAFQCIGPSCEDPCCGDWDIPVDKNTYDKYQRFSSEKLGDIVSAFVIVNQPYRRELYGQILRSSSGWCPFFGADHLCGIQTNYGHQLLSATCSIYPRSLSVVQEIVEGALSLSCPEAARSILLIPNFMARVRDMHSGDFRTDNFYRLAIDSTGKPHNIFLSIRNILITVLLDRSYTLTTRLLMIGYICKQLDAMDARQSHATLLANLRNLDEMSRNSLVQAEIQDLPSDPRSRLETVFGLTDLLMEDEPSLRFQETFLSFVAGIGVPAGSSPYSDVESFLGAERDYYFPFTEAFPFILENYLVNYMFQNLFPYGRSGSDSFKPQRIFTEYLQMTTQFAWMNGLLIGAAGYHKGALSGEHAVKVIQSFSRAVEHYPNVLRSMHRYICSRNFHSLLGMAIILKH